MRGKEGVENQRRTNILVTVMFRMVTYKVLMQEKTRSTCSILLSFRGLCLFFSCFSVHSCPESPNALGKLGESLLLRKETEGGTVEYGSSSHDMGSLKLSLRLRFRWWAQPPVVWCMASDSNPGFESWATYCLGVSAFLLVFQLLYIYRVRHK